MPENKKDDVSDTLRAKELSREYGFGWKFFKQSDDLWELLQKATKESWDDRRFMAEFQATKWYARHKDSYRQAMGLKFTDPATYRDRLRDSRSKIKNTAGQWGADLTDRELDRYAHRNLLFGWDDGQLMDFIAKEVTPNKGGHYGGELSGMENTLRQTALANGVKVGKDQLTQWMRKIVRGDADVRTFEQYIRGIASKTFSAYGKEIGAGMNAVDIAAPYIQSMAGILEMNPASIGMDDRTIRKALTYKNKKGEAVPMSVADFEDNLRADKRWQYTDQARQQMKGYAVELGKQFGILS